MSSQPSTDPYQPRPLIAATEPPPSSRRRPGWFVTICVIAIALGGTGFLHSLYALAKLTVGDPMKTMMRMQSPEGGPAELENLEKQIDQEIDDIEERYYPALLPLALARMALTACLVVGGVGCLAGKPAARMLLVGTMAVAILFEVCDSVVQSFILSEMAPSARRFGQALDDENAAGMSAPPKLAETVMVIVLWGIMCFFFVCQVAKGAFYLGGLLYLRRSSLDPLFERSKMAQAVGP